MRPIALQLDDWFPTASAHPVVSLDDAQRYCRELATTHYENFPVVSWLLPKRLHQHFYNVYAFCRWSDDLGDELGDRQRSLAALNWWRGELTSCFEGENRHPVFVALLPTIKECGIPAQPFHDLISAFEQDQTEIEYATFDELRAYCRWSADPVGRIVLHLCGQFSERNAEWSDSICTGLQLANFWQDVARDLKIGRVYLPIEDCERFGYSRDDLRAGVTNAAFVELMRFEVERTRDMLSAVRELAPRLRGRLQVVIELFGEGGLKVCDRVADVGYRVWEQRPIVTKWDAAGLLLKCLGRALGRKVAA